ncbi:MAG TPA: DUF4340 domain-containing protein [Anaerolineales bacterium]|nr:DUF4340 domain-containing protein [Anaerolineales bacterium]
MARKATNTSRNVQRKRKAAQSETAASKRQKPVFSVGTLFTLVLFAGLFTLAVYLKKQKEIPTEATPSDQISFVFTEADGAPTSIEVKSAAGETVKLARNADNVWALELPAAVEADQGLAEAAATQVSTLRILDKIDADPGIFGLDNPSFIITIEFANGKKHILEVGDNTPTNSGYYVRVDDDKMLITSLSGIDALLQLVTSPPYLNTPTPSPLPPTETPVSTPEASGGSTPETPLTPAP